MALERLISALLDAPDPEAAASLERSAQRHHNTRALAFALAALGRWRDLWTLAEQLSEDIIRDILPVVERDIHPAYRSEHGLGDSMAHPRHLLIIRLSGRLDPLQSLLTSPWLENVQDLHLRLQDRCSIAAQQALGHAHLPALRSLSLTGSLHAVLVNVLAHASWARHMEQLTLEESRLAEPALHRFARSPWEALQKLAFRSVYIPSLEDLLQDNAWCAHLKHLELVACDLHDADMVQLCNLTPMPALEHLDVSSNPLTPLALVTLAQTPSLPRLTTWIPTHPVVGHPTATRDFFDGLTQLVASPHRTQLATVELSSAVSVGPCRDTLHQRYDTWSFREQLALTPWIHDARLALMTPALFETQLEPLLEALCDTHGLVRRGAVRVLVNARWKGRDLLCLDAQHEPALRAALMGGDAEVVETVAVLIAALPWTALRHLLLDVITRLPRSDLLLMVQHLPPLEHRDHPSSGGGQSAVQRMLDDRIESFRLAFLLVALRAEHPRRLELLELAWRDDEVDTVLLEQCWSRLSREEQKMLVAWGAADARAALRAWSLAHAISLPDDPHAAVEQTWELLRHPEAPLRHLGVQLAVEVCLRFPLAHGIHRRLCQQLESWAGDTKAEDAARMEAIRARARLSWLDDAVPEALLEGLLPARNELFYSTLAALMSYPHASNMDAALRDCLKRTSSDQRERVGAVLASVSRSPYELMRRVKALELELRKPVLARLMIGVEAERDNWPLRLCRTRFVRALMLLHRARNKAALREPPRPPFRRA